MGSKGSNTTTTESGPPAQYLAAYSNVENQAQNVASTPYQQYQGNVVAQLSPDQTAGISQVENLTANGGVQQPYLTAAQSDFNSATQPLLTSSLQGQITNASGQGLVAPTASAVSGITNAANTGVSGITNAANSLTPNSLAEWENPYTQQVVQSTEAQLNNQNAQQQSQVTGNAISSGAYGGDRSAVAAALTAGQQQLTEAPEIASLESAGYTTALSAAQQQAALQTQAATSAGSLGLQGATSAGQAGMTGATTESQLGLQGASTELGANEANAWLASQAGFGEANLGSEAQQLGLQGASSELQVGSLEQQMAQENLNIPYEEYQAQEAYPYQTTGWLANIAEGLGGSSGGTSSTTSPGANVGSEVAGLGITGLGLYNAANNAGFFSSANSGANSASTVEEAQPASFVDESGGYGALLGSKYGGAVTNYSNGDMLQRAGGGLLPRRATGGLAAAPDVDVSVVPGASGMGDTPSHAATSNIFTSTGNTSNSSDPGGAASQDLSDVASIASIAALAFSDRRLKEGAKKVGELHDGTPVHRFRYHGDPEWHLGLMHDEVEDRHPEATGHVGGYGVVDLKRATDSSARHGGIPRRDAGGYVSPSQTTITIQSPDQTTPAMQPAQGNASQNWYAPLVQENLDAQMAASLMPPATAPGGMRSGGMVPRKHFDAGGMSIGEESPWWARSEEREATDRHGLLASPVAGRTDQLAISPATGSYVIPADVVSGLGEGNTLAGANVMQRIIDSGPHGIRMPPERHGKGPPRPPPAYREGEGDDGMASGGAVRRYAAGGMSPAVTSYLAGNGLGGYGEAPGTTSAGTGTSVPSTGINASTGVGTSDTGIPALDAYLNQTEAGASFVPPQTYTTPAPAAATSASSALSAQQAGAQQYLDDVVNSGAAANPTGGPNARGGAIRPRLHIPRRADGGPAWENGDGYPDNFDDLLGDDWSGPDAGEGGTTTTTDSPGLAPTGVPIKPPVESQINVPQSMRPARGMGPPAPPSQRGSGMSARQSGSGMDADFDRYASRFQPTQPDLWMDVAEAGAAMAAGRSPHALENIGAGAERGIAAYEQQRQQAGQQRLAAGETAARLADTAAYRQALTGNRAQQIQNTADFHSATNAIRSRANDLRAQGLDETAAWHQAQEDFDRGKIGIAQQNADTGTARLGIAQQNANTSAGRAADTSARGWAGIAQRQKAQDALAAYRTWQQTHQNATQTEKQRMDDWAISQGLTRDQLTQRGQDITARGQTVPKNSPALPPVQMPTPPPAAAGAPSGSASGRPSLDSFFGQ